LACTTCAAGDNYKAEYGIEMYINLDHSPSVEAAKAGIDAGFEFIHIDISQAITIASLEDIIAATKEVVKYAKTTGALSKANRITLAAAPTTFRKPRITTRSTRFTKPAEALEFVQATGVDTFAAASAICMATIRCPSSSTRLLREIPTRCLAPSRSTVLRHTARAV
jgi:fructose/tagatose bisphosphate aldolase